MKTNFDERANVLLVDDSAEKLMTLSVILSDLGQHIVTARSGREALRFLLNQDFAVILLDVNMPGMDGFETAALIRQRKSSEKTPIIFVTAFSDDTHSKQGYSLGAVDYIITPVIPEVLKSKVSVFVDLFRKTAQVTHQAESLRHRATQLHRLSEASLAINSALSFDQILDKVVESARELVRAHDAVVVADVDPTHPVTRMAWSSGTQALEDRVPILDSARHFLSLLRDTFRPVRVSRKALDSDPFWQPFRERFPSPAGTGHLAAPLKGRDGRPMGWIHLSEAAENEFSEDDEAILLQLAQVASIALENTLFSEAREANRLKDEFLTTLSHELRTPLTAILGWTRLLRSNRLDPPRFEHGLDVIERNVAAQAKLIEDLLDVSRIAAGKLRLNVGSVLLVPTLAAAVESMRPAALAKGVSLRFECEDGISPDLVLAGDPDRLQQIVWNLLANAIKFTPAAGKVSVHLAQDPGGCRIEVKDTGLGISPTFLGHVFDRFRQADSTTTRAHGGLGIGLALVQHITEMHGGSVSAQSPGLNQGSTFVVRLPINPPSEVGRPAKPFKVARDPLSTDELAGCRVLLVDDEVDTRDVLAETLRSAGATVEAAASMKEALSLLDRTTPSILISDIAMPGGDGYELIQYVRNSLPEPRASLKAIAVTAHVREEDRLRARTAGFQGFVTKPVEPFELIHAVAELTGRTERGPHRLLEVPGPDAGDEGKGGKILVIEDDIDSRESLKALLEMQGHSVEVAAQGAEGVEIALSHRPEVAIIDIGLPGMDGNEVARQIRDGLAGDAMFLIALTGYSRQKEKRLAIASGFDAHLVKPLNFDELVELLQGRAERVG